jgi:cytochrome c oxidase assembly factor CtaG
LFVTLRAHALSHPLLLFLCFAAAFALLGPMLRRLPERRTNFRRGGIPATYLLPLVYLATVICYSATPASSSRRAIGASVISWSRGTGLSDPAGAGLYGPYGPYFFSQWFGEAARR